MLLPQCGWPFRKAGREQIKRIFKQGIKTTAVDYGGEYVTSAIKIVERAIVAAKREGVKDTHAERGCSRRHREALSQIMPKGLGFNIGENRHARQADHGCSFVFGIDWCTWMKWPSDWDIGQLGRLKSKMTMNTR